MEKEMDPDVIKATQNTLGKFVKRPQLSEKLLKKPPFRFLHDIVTTVIKTTGFFDELFEEEELISDNVKDRDSKIAFLNKVITVVATTTGRSLTVKPSKIVAGQEAEKTNELLQCIGFALENKLSSVEAVQKYKNSSKAPTETNTEKPKETVKPSKKTSDTKKLTSRSSEKLTNNKKDTTERSIPKNEKDRANVKTKSKDVSLIKESPPKKTTSTSKTLVKKKSVEKSSTTPTDKNIIPKRSSIDDSQNNEESPQNNLVKGNADQDSGESLERNDFNDTNPQSEKTPKLEEVEDVKLNSSYTIADNDLNSSLSSQDLMEVDPNAKVNQRVNNHDSGDKNTKYDLIDEEQGQNNVKSFEENDHKTQSNDLGRQFSLSEDRSRNSSHYEDRVRDNNQYESNVKDDSHYDSITKHTSIENTQNIFRPKSVRPSSSRPGAPRLREKHESVVTGTENLLVGKVNIIIENTPNEEEEDSSIIIVDHQPNSLSISQDQQGLQLSTNQQHGALVQQILDSQKEFSQATGKTEIEWQFGAQKAREAINQEIQQLRFNIQALSRAANPLGKVLDHIQEDVEVMRQELQQWTQAYEEASKELLKQKTANEDSLFPLHTKLKQLDGDIEEKHDKINDLKIIIHKNSSRIEKLLASGKVQ